MEKNKVGGGDLRFHCRGAAKEGGGREKMGAAVGRPCSNSDTCPW